MLSGNYPRKLAICYLRMCHGISYQLVVKSYHHLRTLYKVSLKGELGRRCFQRLEVALQQCSYFLIKNISPLKLHREPLRAKTCFPAAPDVTLYIKIKSPTLLRILNRLLVTAIPQPFVAIQLRWHFFYVLYLRNHSQNSLLRIF